MKGGKLSMFFVCACVEFVFAAPFSDIEPSFNGLEEEEGPRAKITPTVYAVQGVDTCGGGKGYCLRGSDCTEVDREFHPDDNKGHCQEMAHDITPYAEFVCCKHIPIPIQDHDNLLTWGDQGNGTWSLPPLVGGPLELAPTHLDEVDDTNMVTLVINGQTFIFSSDTFGSVSNPMELYELLSNSVDGFNGTSDVLRETPQKIHETNEKIDYDDETIFSDSLSSQEQGLVIENDKFTFDGMVVGSFRRRRKPLMIKMPPIPMMPDILQEQIRQERQIQMQRLRQIY